MAGFFDFFRFIFGWWSSSSEDPSNENKKLSELDLLLEVSGDDYLYIVDVSNVSEHPDGSSRKVKVENIYKIYNGSDSINVLGTITQGIWRGSPVESGYLGPHASNHYINGTDYIPIDQISTSEENVNLNVNTNRHGLLPKLNGNMYSFFNGYGEYSEFESDKPDEYICFKTTKTSGNVAGQVRSSTGYAGIQWWDGSVSVVGSGSSSVDYWFSKSIPVYGSGLSGSSVKSINLWPCIGSENPSVSGTLTKFYANNQDLFYLDPNNTSLLNHIEVSSGNLTYININNIPSLTTLSINNQSGINGGIPKLDLRSNTSLTNAYVQNNNSDEIKYKELTSLANLYIGQNNLTSVDVRGMTSLSDLNCSYSPNLTSLIANSGVSNLQAITCNNCSLSSLLLPYFGFLTEINCSGNNLTSLDANSCYLDADAVMYVNDNNMGESALESFFETFSPVGWDSYIDIRGNPGALTCDTSIASDIGYTVITE